MKTLNAQQQKAVDSNSSKILCLAGAGAGKTATMIERISRLVAEGVRPMSILVLTFTNAAGFEMRERYKKTHQGEICPEFRTFHSFCYSLIVKDTKVRSAIGYDKVPTIADEGAIKKIETQAKMQCNIKLSEAKLSGNAACVSRKEEHELELYRKAVDRLIRQANIITFDTLCYGIGELFVKDSECIQKYKSQYKYIFVDEFQDTDPKQIQFLNSFKDVNFYFCGDVLQSIYSFRGCSDEFIKQLAQDDTWEKIKLYENYRSTNQICDFANKMSRYADEAYRIEMHGQRDGDPVCIRCGSQSNWNHVIDADHVDMLLEMIRENNSEDDSAILCRSNREVQSMCDTLTEQGIPFFTAKPNEDAIHILKSSIDNDYMLDWLSTFLNAYTYSEFIRLAAQEENPDITWFANNYGSHPQINKRGKLIVAVRKILYSNSPDISKCFNILQELDIEGVMIDDAPHDRNGMVQYLIECIEDIQSKGLYVGTIHSAKGLEYGTVYVMGVGDKSFPLHNEEMLNLYYVAITRAKHNLVVFKV